MGSVSVRKAESGDLQGILHIINTLELDIPGFVWNKPDFVGAQIARGEYFVGHADNQLAGIISLRQRNSTMYIETLAVMPEFRLQKIGSQLVVFAKNITKERGLQDLCACSFLQYNIGDFYKKQGFSSSWHSGDYNGHKYRVFTAKV